MSLESAKEFLLDFKASDEVGSIVSSVDFKDGDMSKKIDLIVNEAAKRGYEFTASELKNVVDEYAKMYEDDKFENITGGNGKISTIIKSILPYHK